ncbi:hypothetical protein, partial [Flavobacterium caeni]|uniref:hypothetical protein n=1 Tax=Flavobacterium caeni TaxID=490189 RepID=UPI00147EB2B7
FVTKAGAKVRPFFIPASLLAKNFQSFSEGLGYQDVSRFFARPRKKTDCEDKHSRGIPQAILYLFQKTCERAFVAGAKVPPFFTRANFYGKFFRFFFQRPPNTLESHRLRDELFFAGAA